MSYSRVEASTLVLVHLPVGDSRSRYTYRLNMLSAPLIRRPVINRNDQRASKERIHRPGYLFTIVAFDLIARIDGHVHLIFGHG